MKSRLILTFSAYILILIIPITVLFFQGLGSLRQLRQQLQQQLEQTLQATPETIRRELEDRWNLFLEIERHRDFRQYAPWIPIDPDQIRTTGRAFQKSPLAKTQAQLAYLEYGSAEQELVVTTSETEPGNPFFPGVVGYFEFDPLSREISTPYDTDPRFDATEPRVDVDHFHAFLKRFVEPELISRLGLHEHHRPLTAVYLLQQHGARQVKRSATAPRNTNLQSQAQTTITTVSYYDFSVIPLYQALSRNMSECRNLVLYRLVIADDQVHVQGFLMNVTRLLLLAQSFLEPFQPQFGSVVLTQRSGGGIPLFEPLNILALDVRYSGVEHLQQYFDQRKQFGFTMVLLLLALTVSLSHMARLIAAERRLAQQKDDFVSAVTHELKAPLTSIKMYTEMLSEGWARGKEQEYYQNIHTETIRLSRLIRNILDFASLERGTFQLIKRPIRLGQFVRETMEGWHLWLEEKQFQLTFDISADPLVYADADALMHVVFNLCDNSIKYVDHESRPRIHVAIREIDQQAILTYSDNGPGVPFKERDQVFQRFYRCENEMTREHAGTGLGLALVKDVVEAHGGTVTFDDEAALTGFALKLSFPRADESLLEA